MKTFSQLKKGDVKIEAIKNYLKKAEKASKAYNKEDFKSFAFFCCDCTIYIDVEKVYFYPFNYVYHVCIDYFNNTRIKKEFTNKNDLINLLKNFKIRSLEQ